MIASLISFLGDSLCDVQTHGWSISRCAGVRGASVLSELGLPCCFVSSGSNGCKNCTLYVG